MELRPAARCSNTAQQRVGGAHGFSSHPQWCSGSSFYTACFYVTHLCLRHRSCDRHTYLHLGGGAAAAVSSDFGILALEYHFGGAPTLWHSSDTTPTPLAAVHALPESFGYLYPNPDPVRHIIPAAVPGAWHCGTFSLEWYALALDPGPLWYFWIWFLGVWTGYLPSGSGLLATFSGVDNFFSGTCFGINCISELCTADHFRSG